MWDDTHEQKLTLTGRFGSGEHRGKWVFGHLAIVVAFHAQSPAKFRCSSKHWPLNVETLYSELQGYSTKPRLAFVQ